MELRSMFQRLVVLIAVLILNPPFVTLAQQNSGQTAVSEVGAAQDTNVVRLEAETDAQQDASNDFHVISKFLWFSSGAASPLLGMSIGGCVGYLADPLEITEGGGGLYTDFDCSGGAGIIPGMAIGYAVGVLLPFVVSAYQAPIVPAERLLGKSPEYVKSYSDAYRAKVRSLRVMWVAGGTATGCGLLLIGCLVMSNP